MHLRPGPRLTRVRSARGGVDSVHFPFGPRGFTGVGEGDWYEVAASQLLVLPPLRRGILAGTAPSIYHLPHFSPRLPHPSDVLRVERLSKEREADEEAVKAELEPSFGDPHRKASRVHFDPLGLDDHRLLLSMTPYVSNATAPVAHSGTS